jgi:hypothetical protein
VSENGKIADNDYNKDGLLVAMTTTTTSEFGIQKTNNKNDEGIGFLRPQ